MSGSFLIEKDLAEGLHLLTQTSIRLGQNRTTATTPMAQGFPAYYTVQCQLIAQLQHEALYKDYFT